MVSYELINPIESRSGRVPPRSPRLHIKEDKAYKRPRCT